MASGNEVSSFAHYDPDYIFPRPEENMNFGEPMNEQLVSLLTPCFNAEPYVHRLLDSVLSQTWPNVEMIVVDDGSTDKSFDILASYVPKFRARGYDLRILHQENAGQSAAVNVGLKLVRGEYLAWPDADDWYATPTALERLVGVLRASPPEVAVIYSRVKYLSERTLRCIREDPRTPFENVRLFEDCIFHTNRFQYAAGSFLIRFSAFEETTGREIWTAKGAGQNWQLLLPLLYKYNASFLNEHHYNILHRRNSHSRGDFTGSFEVKCRLLRMYERTILETLRRISDMGEQERADYERRVRTSYDRTILDLALKWAVKPEIRAISNRLGFRNMMPSQRFLVPLELLTGSSWLFRASHRSADLVLGVLRRSTAHKTR